MTVNRSRPLQLRLCAKCEKEHPATLFNAKGFCVYCAQAAAQADDAKVIEKKAAKVGDDPLEFRRKAHLDIQARKRSALAKISADKAAKVDQNAELDSVEAAKQELARRELAKSHLLPFIMRFNDKYEPGWVHKDICDKLEWFSAAVAAKQSPRLMIFMPPRHGKEVAHSTPVLTTMGWKTHGELRVGDEVFHPSGRPVRVLAVAAEEHQDDYLVETTAGEVIRCHANHEWTVYDRSTGATRTVETRWFLRQTKFGKPAQVMSAGRAIYQLPEVAPLVFAEQSLPIHPYVLGAWLGDGTRGKGCITHAEGDRPIVERIESLGYTRSASWTHRTTGVVTTAFSGPRPGVAGRLLAELQALDATPDKHIPEVYLRSSVEQRLELLAGLIDTDGHACRRTGRMRFTTADRRLAEGVMDLCAGLGFRPYCTTEQPKRSSSGVQGRREYYVVGFQPTLDVPCVLPRKRPTRLAPQRAVGITAVRVEPNGEKGRCIQVDAPDGLYLVGRHLTPTHNSEIGSRSFPAWHLGRYPEHEFIGCSYGSDLANGFSRKVREVVRDPAFTAVFPECAVNKDSQSVEQWLTTKGGGYAAAGVGGAITGKGAHCVSSQLSVTTRRGKIPANQVRVGEEVLGYDHESGQPVWATVEAVSTTRKPELVRTGALVCTPDHRVWTENRGYIHAGELTPADDLVALRVLRDRVPSQVEGASERNSQAGEPVNPPADVLLATVRSQRTAGSGEAHLPRVRWGEGAPREDLQQMLRDAARYGEGQAAMRPVCDDIRPECGGIRESEAAPRRRDLGVLLPGLLRAAPTDPYSGDPADGTRVPDLQSAGHGAQAAEVLLPRVLSGEPAQHFGEGLQRLSGRVATDASTDTASRPPVPPVHAVRGDGGASYRPRLDEPCGDELDRPLSGVPFLVSCDAGACAADLETGLYGPGFDVVDLQTSTENFFAGNILVHNCLVIDDPVKNRADAESATSREAVWDWYTSTAYTRLAPGGGVLVILTRWHDDDLAGRLLRKQAEGEGDEWVVVEYPAQAVHDELFRKAGEPLHPERYGNEALERTKRAVGPRDWQALFQQNPTPDEGDYFNKGMFQWYGPQDIPDYSELNFYTAWDFAIGEKEQNDYSVGITVGVDKSDRVFVVDIQRGHWGTLELVDKVMEVYKTWRPAITGLERGHIEMTMRPFLDKRIREERLTSFYIEELKPGTRDKIARARSIQGRMQQGLVFFRKNCNATATLVAEMMRFPNGVHDDQCLVAGTRVSTPGGACDIERVKPGDWVTTPVGPRMVMDAQCTGEAAVYRLETVCGRVIEGSGNHPIYTANRGFVRMDAIKWYDQLLVEFAPCQASKPSKWTVFVSAVTRILRTASIGSIFRRIAVTMHRLSTCTGISGNAPTAPSRRGTTSITSTEIR